MVPPSTPEPPSEDYYPVSEPTQPQDYFEAPVYSRDEAYENIRDTEGITYDPFASELLWTAFFDPDVTPDERHSARLEYFEYMGYDDEGDFFAWDEWRDWYETTTA